MATKQHREGANCKAKEKILKLIFIQRTILVSSRDCQSP